MRFANRQSHGLLRIDRPTQVLFKQSGSFQNLLWTGTHPIVLRHIHPAHHTIRIQEKFCRPRDILPAGTSTSMQQIVTTNHFSLRIGKKRKRVTGLLHQVARDFRTVNADRDRPNTRLIKTRQFLFNTPQLGVARRSPVTSIKHKQRAFRSLSINRRSQHFVKRHLPAVRISQRELRNLLPNVRRIR